MPTRHQRLTAARELGAFQATQELVDRDIDMTRPIDVFDIIEKENVWLVFGPLEKVLGFYLNTSSKGVFINNRRPRSVQRLTGAHEFGHICLGHQASLDDQSDIDASEVRSEQEAAAQGFALDFMMPLTLVESQFDALQIPFVKDRIDPRQAYMLSLMCGVSFRACIVQLGQMDKLSRAKAQEFLKWSPKEIKRLIGAGVGPQDPWADVWPLDESDSGRLITLRVNDEVRLKLPERPSTGYRWVSIEEVTNELVLVADEFEGRSVSLDEVGGGGDRFLSYRAARAGRAEIDLKLARPWQATEAVQVFVVQCQIEDQPTGGETMGLRIAARERFISDAVAGG